MKTTYSNHYRAKYLLHFLYKLEAVSMDSAAKYLTSLQGRKSK